MTSLCNLYSLTKGQQAIRELSRATVDRTGNMPLLPGTYTKRIHDTHWSGVRKYFQIRRLTDGGQAIDQVWLSAPGVAGIRFEDDSISSTAEGPDLPLGAGTIQGEIGFAPAPGHKPGDAVPLVQDFLKGLLAHGGIALPEES
jgi:hypothetical protein